MNTPIILLTFGSKTKSAQNFYNDFESKVRTTFPNKKIYWAYTSKTFLTKQTIGKLTLEQAYVCVRKNGFKSAIVQSLHIVAGEQHNVILNTPHNELFVKFTDPLLVTYDDINNAAINIIKNIPIDRPVLVVGHGNSKHYQYNKCLIQLGELLSETNRNMAFMLIDGPKKIQTQIKQFILNARKIGKIHIYPLFLIAGHHVNQDILGSHIQSIKSICNIQDFTCSCPLWQQKWVQDRFLYKLNKSMYTNI